jgi:hypothetical protein
MSSKTGNSTIERKKERSCKTTIKEQEIMMHDKKEQEIIMRDKTRS